MRACVGRSLALTEMTAFIGMTLSRFGLELVSDAPVELTGAYSLRPRDPVLFRLRPLA